MQKASEAVAGPVQPKLPGEQPALERAGAPEAERQRAGPRFFEVCKEQLTLLPTLPGSPFSFSQVGHREACGLLAALGLRDGQARGPAAAL